MRAVCIRCGNAKRYAPERCAQCGFTPRSDTDLAKSFILSAAFDVGDRTIGRAAGELSRIAGAISSGQPYEFSGPEVAAVEKQVAAFRVISARTLLVSLVKWLGPPILYHGHRLPVALEHLGMAWRSRCVQKHGLWEGVLCGLASR